MLTSASNQPQKMKEYELFLMGHPIFKANQPGEICYILVEGEAAIYQYSQLVETLQPGEILDKVSLDKIYGLDYVVFAKINCCLVSIDEQIAAVLTAYPPDFRVQAMRVMVERLAFRLTPPIQLTVRPPVQSPARPLPKMRSTSDTFGIVATVGY
jgi:CRP-like cAMP-binding protein